MRFIRGFWKVLVGVKDALVLLFMLLFFAGLYFALSATPHAGGPTSGALVLRLDGPIVEQPAEVDPRIALSGQTMPREYRLAEVIHALDRAAQDGGVQAVAMDLDIFAGGRQAALADVGAAMDRVRRAGKPVLVYATGYTDDTYQLAAHASEVWMNPMGTVLITGPGGVNLYYAQLLERLGITANVYRVGAFKSAVEPYTRSDMSPEARQASQALADAMWSQWRQEVRTARPRAEIDAYVADPAAIIARHNGDMALAARESGLIDQIGDRAQFSARMREIVGAGEANIPNSFRAIPYDTLLQRSPLQSASGGNVAVLTVAGTIVDGEAGAGTAGAETIVATLETALRQGRMRALVVRIDSPGGSALASERIRRAIEAVRDRGIPVVVSMGSVAASGGYWIATVGQRVYAEPTTLTGSIGVFGIVPSFEGTLRNIGVGADGVQTTPLSGEPNVFAGPSDAADRLLQLGVEGTYRRFLMLVARTRNLPPERVHQIAQGRVWDGGTARQLGLVDQFGRLEDAVADAAQRAGIEQPTISYLEPQTSWLTRFLGQAVHAQAPAAADPFARLAQRPQALLARAAADAESLLSGPTIQARCLDCPPAYDGVAMSATGQSLIRLLLTRRVGTP